MSLAGIEMEESEYVCMLSNSKRFEFTNGVVTAKRGPYMTEKAHVIVAEEFSAAIRELRRTSGGFGGQTPTANLSDTTDRLYRIPDLAYWEPGRPVGDSIFTPPTLAVELVSPDQSVPTLREKCRLYRTHGVDIVWLVHPDQRWAEVFDEGRDGERLVADGVRRSRRLPGLEVRLADLWQAIDSAPA